MALLLVGLGVGCTPTGRADGGDDCGTALAWGHARDGGFMPFRDGDRALVTEGFQGFRFVVSAARVTGAGPGTARFDFDVSVDGEAPFSQPSSGELTPGGESLYAHEVLLFFNDLPMSQLLGKSAEVLVRTTAGCGARQRIVVQLAADTCRQVEDGGYQCDAG